VRRDSKRSSLVGLVTVLNELRERNNRSLAAVLTLISSDDFKSGDDQFRSGIIDSRDRLCAVHAAVTEALLHTLHECDAEWGFAGRLHAAFRSQIHSDPDKDCDKFLAQHGLR